MATLLLVLAALSLTLAAAIHVFIFYLESIAWTGPRAASAFGLTGEQAEHTRQLAFNQGFYNLFLALLIILGLVLQSPTLAAAGALVMVGAGAVLILSDATKLRAGLIQAGPPALGLVLLALAIATGSGPSLGVG